MCNVKHMPISSSPDFKCSNFSEKIKLFQCSCGYDGIMPGITVIKPGTLK